LFDPERLLSGQVENTYKTFFMKPSILKGWIPFKDLQLVLNNNLNKSSNLKTKLQSKYKRDAFIASLVPKRLNETVTIEKLNQNLGVNSEINFNNLTTDTRYGEKFSDLANREEMDTISTVLNHLKLKKWDNEFTIDKQGSITLQGKLYDQKEFKIIKMYRFEGDSDPSDEAIIYVIEANDGIIGYSLDAYGVYSNHSNDGYSNMMHNMRTQSREKN